jgi:hypothetical protein
MLLRRLENVGRLEVCCWDFVCVEVAGVLGKFCCLGLGGFLLLGF